MPAPVVDSGNTFKSVAAVKDTPISAVTAPLAESKKGADGTAIVLSQDEKDAAVPRAAAQGKPGETLALTDIQAFYPESPQASTARVNSSKETIEGAKAEPTRTAEISASKAGREVADASVEQKIDVQWAEITPAGAAEESSRRNLVAVKSEAEAAVRPPAEEPHEESIATSATIGVSRPEFEVALTPVSTSKQVEQPVVQTHHATDDKPVSVSERKNATGPTVQIGDEKPASNVAPVIDENALPAQMNRERTARRHPDGRPIDHNGVVKADFEPCDSPRGHKGANTGVIIGIGSAAPVDRGSKPTTDSPASETSASMPRPVETAARLPESFVPGGTQLLLRLSHQEMRFGWNTPDFGHIEVRATVEHDRVGAVVSADARLCDSLEADLGSLSRSLANQSLRLAQFQTSSSNSNGNATPDQNAPATAQRVARDEGANGRLHEVGEPILSIHQGALDLRA
jgi:hypothetical protein